MNAPATQTAMRPDPAAGVPPNLRAWELIRTLVAFDTTSRESNLALIEWVRGYLEAHGVECALTFDDDLRKANLFATLAARDGNATTGGIVLSGHTDVVPVDGQPWDTESVRGHADRRQHRRPRRHRHEELFGDGARVRPRSRAPRTDAPGAFRAVVRRGDRLYRRAADDRRPGRARRHQPLGCIVGEPTGMELVVAHKGKKSWRCRVRGHEAHSSLTPHGVNAVQIACEIVTYLARVARAFRDEGRYDDAYDVPYTTVHTGIIRGGTALNIVPRDCWFDFEIRHLPFDDPDEILAEARRARSGSCPRCARCRRTPASSSSRSRRCPASTRMAESAIAALGQRLQRLAGTSARCRSARKRGCSTTRRSRRSSADRATSRRHISRTSGCRWTSSPAARRSCGALRRPRCARVTPSATADRGRLSRISTAWAAGNAGIPYVWTFVAERARPARPAAGADARQRGVRRDSARLAARRGVPPDARHVDACASPTWTRTPASIRADPFASRCVDEDFNRLWTAEVLDGPRRTRRSRSRARAAAALRARGLPARPALDDRPLPAARHGRTAAQGCRARAGDRRRRSTSSSMPATRRASGCATTRSSTIPTTRATRC